MREDFIDAPSAGTATTAAAAPQIGTPRRPVDGGWALMVAAGLIAAVANYAVLTAEEQTAAIAVVTVRAPAGTPVEALELRAVDLPVADPGAHLLVPLDAVADRGGTVTTTALEVGSLLRATDLREPAGVGVGAMALPVEAARAVGGLLQAGDRVDVIAAMSTGAGDPAQVGYVVRDVEVIAVQAPATGVGQVGGGSALTVAVDADQALALAAALRTGEIDVVRSGGPPGAGR